MMPRGLLAVRQLSLDGAMVPLVGGEWAEVKTLAIGTVGRTLGADRTPAARTTELSYFSRLAEAEAFLGLARKHVPPRWGAWQEYEEQVSTLKRGPLVQQELNGRYADYEALKLEFV